jgi:beta-glucanase (GH16 family)
VYSHTSTAIASVFSRVGRLADRFGTAGLAGRRGALIPGVIATLGLAACGGVDDDTPSGSLDIQPIEWQLVFEDEFDGDSLDTSKWNIDEGDGCPDLCGWGNDEQQIYSADNITVADGVLTIEGRQEGDGTYTSGRINTKGKFDFRYGKVEVKAKIPAGQGTWPAIWMLHSDPTIYGPWPLSGEIDIMEAFNLGVDDNNAIRSSLHYGLPTQPPEGTTAAYGPAGFAPDMNSVVYTMEWERDKIRFYVDGEHWQSQKGSEWYVYYPAAEAGLFETDLYDEYSPYQVGTLDSPFDQLFHLIINFAVGGNPVGDPDPDIFPQTLEVDYVRVYECANANPDTGRGCGTADASVVPLDDNDGNELEELTTDTPYRESLPLFTDGPETLSITVGDQTSTNTLQVGGFTGEGATVINDPAFVDPDDPENIIWHVAVSGGVANAYLESEAKSDDPEDPAYDPILQTGFDFSGNRLGDLGGYPVGEVAFDMLVNSIDEGTDLIFKLQSDDPVNRGEVILPQSELLIGEWKSYSIKFDMFLANAFPEGDGVDLENVLLPFVIEVQNGSADVFLDNIRATNACQVVGACGADLKSTLPDVVVFDDAVNTAVFSRGIVGWDGNTGFDYTDGDDPNKKVNWREIDSDDAARGKVLEVTFNDQPNVNSVWFIGSTGTDLSAYNAGAVEFDIKVDDYGDASGITFKIDCTFPCGSGDRALGKVGDGEWETVSYPVARLLGPPTPPSTIPLDLEIVTTGIVLLPTNQAALTFEVDNIRWVGQAGDIPLDQIDLPVTFDDPLTDYTLINFGGHDSVVGEDPSGADNSVAVTTKTEGSEVWAGTTIGTAAGFANPIPFTADQTSMSVDVLVPVAGIPVRLKVETLDCPTDGSDTSCFAELDAFPMMAGEWETLTWDFAGTIDTTLTYQKASIFFDFDTAGDGSVYYWDNVRFGAPPPPPVGDNLLSNPGFETGDFAGWTITAGDNVVGAPAAGARSGEFAAQLTVTGGGDVPEVRQTFPASPGDEVNLSVWMLTEAAIPEGVSFGLAKIVFRDADGVDLVPASASIGVINTEFPGIESEPILDSTSPVGTWVFSQAQGVAPEGTAEVSYLLLNVDFAGGENPIWFDDAQAVELAGDNALGNPGFESGDFTDWTITAGNNVVGAPAAGARSGEFAAQLTVTGGGDVPEVRQTFAANPGDEVSLSAWLLTEAAIPEGVSFGLAKIVFRDADGVDLVPASASIGVINTEFPGIESEPILDSTSPVGTWVFSQAQGVAPAGTVEVSFLLLNVDFAGGENPIWFDDALAVFVGEEGGGGLNQIDLPVTFDDPTVDYTVQDFGDPVSVSTMLADGPPPFDKVAVSTKPTGAPGWAGTTIGNPDFANPIPFTPTETLMSVDVFVPVAGIPIRLKVETADCPSDGSDVTCFAETDAFPTMADTWETLTWDFGPVGIDTTKTFVKASIFFDFGTEGNDASYVWDNVRFGGDEPPPPEGIELVNGDFETGDFTGWVVIAGDDTVGAPAAGAQSGVSAAQLTTTGGGGVAEIRQVFAASPGDEVNFSTWMLTEAPLPTGATFGLAKIVFKDAAGNDLPPESASIGVINFDFPGIESQPFADATTPVDTWVFSEAQGISTLQAARTRSGSTTPRPRW